LLAAACVDREPDGPQPLSVEPAAGTAGHATSIRILGKSFHPAARPNFDDEEKATLSFAFEGLLGADPLQAVVYLEAGVLGATVPPSLPVGSHDLTVIDPRGKRGLLPAAFRVVATPPDAGPDRRRPDLANDLPAPDQKPSVERAPDLPLVVDLGQPDLYQGLGVSTIAGNGTQGFADGPAGTARFANPRGIALHGATIYLADHHNHRIRAITAGQVSTVAGSGTQGYKNGAAASAELNNPDGIAVDSTGAIFVADSSNDVIRRVAAGMVTTVAGANQKGMIDGPAASARFNYPRGIDVAAGVVYVADAENHRIRKIVSGVVSTVAGSSKGFADGPVASARFSSPSGIVVVGTKIYVADSGNNRVRVIDGGTVTTIAGTGAAGLKDGPGASAEIWNPVDLAVTTGGVVYVTHQSHHRIRKIASGVVSTLTGIAAGYQDGPVASALFNYPAGIVVGSAGEIYVADQSNQRIRLIK
jgi:YVTN family beta-propeller protein